jgi:hypothetical protein
LVSTENPVKQNTTWKLSVSDIIVAAGAGGLLHFENMTDALPLIFACQMDETCSLETSPLGDDLEGDNEGKGNQVICPDSLSQLSPLPPLAFCSSTALLLFL